MEILKQVKKVEKTILEPILEQQERDSIHIPPKIKLPLQQEYIDEIKIESEFKQDNEIQIVDQMEVPRSYEKEKPKEKPKIYLMRKHIDSIKLISSIKPELPKEKQNIPSKNKIKKKYTFDYLKNSNHNASYSMPKNKKYNQSFSLEKPKNNYLSKGVTSAITPDVNTIQKSEKNKNFYQRNQSAENMQTIQRNKTDISKEIETLINNYSSKKDIKVYNSESTENFDEGLNQLKVINNDMKEIEKGLKEMVSNISIDDNE